MHQTAGVGSGGDVSAPASDSADSSRRSSRVSTPAAVSTSTADRRGDHVSRCGSAAGAAQTAQSDAEPIPAVAMSDGSDSDGEGTGQVDFDELIGSESHPEYSGTWAGEEGEGGDGEGGGGGEEEDEDVPEDPGEAWTPTQTVGQWTDIMWRMFPGPLVRWIMRHESTMRVPWARVAAENRTALPELQKVARKFAPADRKQIIMLLFKTKKLFETVAEEEAFASITCGFPDAFGHAQYMAHADIADLKAVLGVGDCFFAMVDDEGFPDEIIWDPSPRVNDPDNFQAGGVHEASARAYWDTMPNCSKWVRHWVHNKIWFEKAVPHRVDRSAKNADYLDPQHKLFDQDKFDFLDGKIAELVRCGAVVELPDGCLPDVLTRLSLAPKPGIGDIWRIIMDMRPENSTYSDMRVRMEHLAHFSTIFEPGMLLFSCDLKSAYFSWLVDPRVSRTMGFMWKGKYFRFTCLPFGWKLSSYSFVKAGRQILKKWRAQGPGNWAERCRKWQHPAVQQQTRCMTYIDDNAAGHKLFCFAVWLRNAMLKELLALGFSLSRKGELLPLPSLELLGMIAHGACPKPTWHLPFKKEESLLQVCDELLQRSEADQAVLCRSVAKYVGKLVSASRAVPVSRIMFREVNACIYGGNKPAWGGETLMSKPGIRDMRWIASCFRNWNARGAPIWVQSMLVPVERAVVVDAGPRAVGFQVREIESQQVLGDFASLPSTLLAGWSDHAIDIPVQQAAVSADSGEVVARQSVCADDAAAGTITSAGTIDLTDSEHAWHHVHKELLAVYLSLKSQCRKLNNRRICIFVDAKTTVAYLNNWGGPKLVCCRLMRRIWGVCARNGIRIVQVSHIAGDKMITVGVDALSRPYRFARGGEADRDEWRLMHTMFQWLQEQLHTRFTIDRMASRSNAQVRPGACSAYCSMSSVDPSAVGRSAFLVDWNEQRLYPFGQCQNYCFPPFAFIPRVLQHVRECRASATLIVPNWPSQAWWADLMALKTVVLEFPDGPVFERVCDGEWQPVTRMSFRPLAVVVSAVGLSSNRAPWEWSSRG